MSSTFTPSQAVDPSKEKDWPMHLGMLDWDATKIVFTKRSLVEFLNTSARYTGITVDPGFTNIQKLPRYAQFGKLTADAAVSEEAIEEDTTVQSPSSGGVQQLLEGEFPDDALSTAPPPPPVDDSDSAPKGGIKPSRRVRTIPGGADSIGDMFSNEDTEQQFVPTRRVRQRPGGQDNIEGLF